MNEFWLWFWRPIAETLGVLALLAVIGAIALLAYWSAGLLTHVRKQWRKR